jgi:hypothetical protein
MILSVLVGLSTLHATSASSLFEQAQKLSVTNFELGKTHYLVAAEKYVTEAKNYDSAESKGRLLYNAANAYYLADDLGHAMLYYLRTEKLIPNNHQLYMNLQFVKSQRVDSISSLDQMPWLDRLLSFHYSLSPPIRLGSFVVLYFLTLTLFWIKKPHSWLKSLRIMLLLVSLVLVSSIVVHRSDFGGKRGVIVAREVTAVKGPGPLYESAFQTSLHAGTTFKLLGHQEEWSWVELADGKQCWLPSNTLELL